MVVVEGSGEKLLLGMELEGDKDHAAGFVFKHGKKRSFFSGLFDRSFFQIIYCTYSKQMKTFFHFHK